MKRIGYLIVALTVALAACTQEPPAAVEVVNGQKPIRLAVARFQHET